MLLLIIFACGKKEIIPPDPPHISEQWKKFIGNYKVRKKMIKRYYIFLTLFGCTILSFAQETEGTTPQKTYKNSVFIELLGATGYFSLNYERNVQLSKQLHIKLGGGGGYFVKTNYTPFILSYVLRFDLQYSNKKISPIGGYAFSHNFDLENTESPYLVHSLNLGINIKIMKRLDLLPKFYMMFFYEPKYSSKYIIYWSGLQIKYKF